MHSAVDILIGQYRTTADRFARNDLHSKWSAEYGKPFADYVRGLVEADEQIRASEKSIRKLPVRKRQGMGR